MVEPVGVLGGVAAIVFILFLVQGLVMRWRSLKMMRGRDWSDELPPSFWETRRARRAARESFDDRPDT